MTSAVGSRQENWSCRRGDWVTVRSLAEILATLDGDAKFEALPFMPEMVRYCGQTFRVSRRVQRTCVEGTAAPRQMTGTVFLDDLRCDGALHQGCQRGCLLFWKTAWLKPAVAPAANDAVAADPANASRLPTTQGHRFYCQSTELAGATSELPDGNLRYYLQDLRSGEVGWRRMAHVVWLMGLGFLWRRLFKREYYRRPVGTQEMTDRGALRLRAGEWVEVKSAAEITATLDCQGRNRGLTFEPEMLYHCGRRYRVAGPLRTIIGETTGEMIALGGTVILENVVCGGICLRNCPRANYFYWREVWLKRV